MKHFHQKYLNFILLLSIILFSWNIAWSQNQYKDKISLLILDGDTYEGISNVHITIKQTNKGAATYSSGLVNLEVVNFPVRLHLSHVSYIETDILINQKPTDTLVVFLNPKTVMLDEISVTSEFSLKQKNFSIIDFEICDEAIYALGYDTDALRSYEIRIFNNQFEPLYAIALPDSIVPTGLFRDCMDCCHYLTINTANQIIRFDTIWEISYQYSLDKFHEVMDDCLFKTKNHVFFKHFRMDNFSQMLFAINTKTKTRHYFIQNEDRNQYKKLIEQLGYVTASVSARNKDIAYRFEKEFMYKPRINTLACFGDTVFHYNFTSGEIEYYTENELEKILNTKLDDHLITSIWNDKIYTDKAKNKAYLIRKRQLFEINDLTGEIIPRIKVKMAYKTLIDSGYIYYLVKVENPFGGYKTIIRETIN